MAAAEESEAGHGQSISQAHGGIQAEGRGAVREIGRHVRRGGARAGLRRGQPGRLGQEGRRRRARARRQPVPDGRGPAQAEEGKRAAQARERDTFESERLLRQQAAAGLSAKRAKFESISLNEPDWPASETCAALEAARRGYCAWKSRPPSAHALRDEELAEPISQARTEARNVYGAPEAFMRLRALGVRTSRKRVARIMRERGWRGAARVRRAPLGREAGVQARIGAGPRPAAPAWRGSRASPTRRPAGAG